jgi:hypothetical protein
LPLDYLHCRLGTNGGQGANNVIEMARLLEKNRLTPIFNLGNFSEHA